VVTATNPPPNTRTPARNSGSDDDHQVDTVGSDQEDSRHGQQRTISAPARDDGTATGASDSVRVPLPRQGDSWPDGTVDRSQTAVRRTKGGSPSGSSLGTDSGVQLESHNQVPATLTTGPDGALWVTVDGADVQQLAARISAVCDVLIRAQPRR
jgi:hypothetical protein